MQVRSLSIVYYSYETIWDEKNYVGGKQEFLVVDLRNFRDPYIRASTLTLGCSTKYKKERTCFPTDPETDMTVVMMHTRILIAAYLVTILEVLVLVCSWLSHSPGGSDLLHLHADSSPHAEEAQHDPPSFDCLSQTPPINNTSRLRKKERKKRGVLTDRRTPNRSSRTSPRPPQRSLRLPRKKTAPSPSAPWKTWKPWKRTRLPAGNRWWRGGRFRWSRGPRGRGA